MLVVACVRDYIVATTRYSVRVQKIYGRSIYSKSLVGYSPARFTRPAAIANNVGLRHSSGRIGTPRCCVLNNSVAGVADNRNRLCNRHSGNVYWGAVYIDNPIFDVSLAAIVETNGCIGRYAHNLQKVRLLYVVAAARAG